MTIRRWPALGVLTLGVLLIGVDGTVVSLATRSSSPSWGATATDMLWVGDVYSFVLAGLLVTMGSLGDRIGHRRLLLCGAGAFAAASVATAYAPTVGLLIGARPAGCRRCNPGAVDPRVDPRPVPAATRARCGHRRLGRCLLGRIGAGAGRQRAPGGPLLGGSVFLVNVPVAVVLWSASSWCPRYAIRTPDRGTCPASSLSLAGTLGLVYAVKEGAAGGLHVEMVIAGAGGMVALALFARRQLRLTTPLIDVRLFADRAFSGVVVANLLSVLGLSVVFFPVPVLSARRRLFPDAGGSR